MSIFRHSNIKMRISLALALTLCLGLIVVALMSFPSPSRAQLEPVQKTKAAKKTESQQFVPGKVLVRYKSESVAKLRTGSLRLATRDGELLSMKVEDFGVSSVLPGLRLARVDENDTLKAIGALREQPDVLYAEPDYILKANVEPNDPRFEQQGYLHTIGAPTAWNTTTGSNSIVVGVLDNGIDLSHQDLNANRWINPQPGSLSGPLGITGDVNGYNFVNNNGTIFVDNDKESHATHVAGVLGAVGNNGVGVAGVNWSVKLMSLRFLDETGTGETSDAVRACVYAKRMRDLWLSSGQTQGANIRVINASFGGARFTQSFLDSITELNNAGIMFVAAAGNTTDDGTREPDNDRVPHFPSSFNAPNVIAVSSTNLSDILATDFSHFGGTSVDLAAPGDSILSTTPPCANPGTGQNNFCNPTFTEGGETYTSFSGTSMSTPQVSGAAALLWSHNPNLTVQQVKSLLLLDGDVVPSLIDKTLTGRRLNIANSFQSLAENDTTAPGPVTNFHINSQNGRTFNVGWTTSGDDGANGQASLYQLNFTDGGSGAVIPLKGILPLASGFGQIATVTIPFRHLSGTLSMLAFDNAGNQSTPVSLPIGIPQSIGDPYTSSTGPSVALSTGGTNLNPNEDDIYTEFSLPSGFSFPFFGTNYTELNFSTNGAIYFGDTPPLRPDSSADDVPSSPSKLGGYTAIAGLWDDLNLEVAASRPDAGVFFISNPNQVIFRWQGRPCDFNGSQCTGTAPVNFEIELNSNGVIKTRYGSGNANLQPTVGIAGGGQEAYFIPTHTSEDTPISLGGAAEVTFTPRAATLSTIQLSGPSFNVTEGANTVSVEVTRTGDTSSFATVSYATNDGAGAANCNTNGTTASRRCDYLTNSGTLNFAGGETSKTISVSIINDVYAENAETFSIGLTSPVGATLGTVTSATITINDNASEGGPNPINDAAFFVRQHYVDFLNREPDASGLAFWTNQITSCGSDTQCTEVRRINVSAAFFLSIEFQETGYLVYRIYKAGFGDLPNLAPVPVAFNEFLRDTQEIGKNVQVNVGDWQNQLEANKQAFAIAFVQRPEFLAEYPAGMTATQVVNQMEANAGVTLSAPTKTSLINLLGATPADLSRRGAALRAVAEADALRVAEFNKAFVLMQYFGYLRRSPNELPDSDYGGFNFWLGKLNQFNGNFIEAEMVKAFITSGEYLRRFQN
jgi:subtilisin family serine protease